MRMDHVSASARSAARTAFLATWRAVTAPICMPMIQPLQMTLRVLVDIARITAAAKLLSNLRYLVRVTRAAPELGQVFGVAACER